MNNLLNKIEEHKGIFKADTWVLVYKYDKIIMGKLEDTKGELETINLESIKEARIFNNNDELKLWRYNGKIKQRLFSETKRSDYEIYSESMLLLEKEELPNGAIQVENYYTYDDNGLIEFHDARITEVVDK